MASIKVFQTGSDAKGTLEDLRGIDYYARIPEGLVYDKKAPDHALKVYGALDRHLNKRTLACFPGQRTIARKTGISRSTVQKCLDYLEQQRFIRIHPPTEPGGSSRYQLTPVHGQGGVDRQEVRGVDRHAVQGGPPDGPGVDRVAVRNQSSTTRATNQSKEGDLNKRIRDLTDWWCSVYADHHDGAGYTFQGAKDHTGAKTIVQSCDRSRTPVNPIELARFAWTNKAIQGDKFLRGATRTMAGFGTVINQVLPEFMKAASASKPSPYRSEEAAS